MTKAPPIETPDRAHALGVRSGHTPGTLHPGEAGTAGAHNTMEPDAGIRTAASVPAEPVLTVIAHGTPGPQGSKNGRVAPNGVGVIMHESSKKVAPWRKVVREAAKLALPPAWALLDEPLEISMVFTLHRGVTVKRRCPSVYPDLSKLARSTEDALTGVVWKDDSRIVRYRSLAKCYPLAGPDALNFPGVVVRIYRLTGEAA